MRVGVLGGGLQGCCTAIALAERGLDVVLFDRNASLLSRTAIANEGKIHLGYMYAGDATLATARTMMTGALAFAPFIERYLGTSRPPTTSTPAVYAVHRDSQHDVAAVSRYLTDVHRLIKEAAAGRERAYFGTDLSGPLRPWSHAERAGAFDEETVLAVFDTPEVAINPIELAGSLTACLMAHPRIEIRLGRNVLGAEHDGNSVCVASEGREGRSIDTFGQVVNALWDGRLALDATMGFRPDRPWLHRLKYGVNFTMPPDAEPPPSVTFVSGPFGEVVSYPDRMTYLTWYPHCLRSLSTAVTPPDWPTYPGEPARSQVLQGTTAALSGIVTSLAKIDIAGLPDVSVKGGVIVAWGETDIYDPASELHRRYEIGVTSKGRYHSIDPGKLTMAPYFAEECASRIAASA